jgi:hypothetical protein
MGADYMDAVGLRHSLNNLRGDEHLLDFPYFQFNF